MTAPPTPAAPSRWMALFFHHRGSMAAIVLVMIAAPIAIGGVGALVPMALALVALIGGRRQGAADLLGFVRPPSWSRLVALSAATGFGLQILFHVLLDPLVERLAGAPVDLSHFAAVEGNVGRALLLLVVGWVSGGFLEELAFRGYLIPRVRVLAGGGAVGTAVAVVASVVPFGLAHLYQGWTGVVTTGATGLCLALIFVFGGRGLWYAILTHGFVNTSGILFLYLGWTDLGRLF